MKSERIRNGMSSGMLELTNSTTAVIVRAAKMAHLDIAANIVASMVATMADMTNNYKKPLLPYKIAVLGFIFGFQF